MLVAIIISPETIVGIEVVGADRDEPLLVSTTNWRTEEPGDIWVLLASHKIGFGSPDYIQIRDAIGFTDEDTDRVIETLASTIDLINARRGENG